VHLNVPVDLWHQPCPPLLGGPLQYRATDTAIVAPRAIEDAATVLAGARTPVIIAGSGVATSSARAALARLATELGARVVTSPRAKGCLAEDHPLSSGVLGFAGHPAAKHMLLQVGLVDVVLVVGASLGETATFNWDPRLGADATWIQLDIDPTRIGRGHRVDVGIVADATAGLTALIEALDDYPRAPTTRPHRAGTRAWIPARRSCVAAPRSPSRLSAGVTSSMPRCPTTR
jgi:acetolactate synthase-1/2/3 large subunit